MLFHCIISSRKLFLTATLDREFERKITVVVVGGTAITLYEAKTTTIDADFTIPTENFSEFLRALDMVPHGFKVPSLQASTVFSQDLLEDYLQRSRPVKARMNRMELRILDPIDIVVTKIGRLNARDKKDIQTCVKRVKITETQIKNRAKEIAYVGRQENYEINLNHVLKNLSS